jgi:hypothetical protein
MSILSQLTRSSAGQLPLAYYRRHGVDYRLSRFQTGPNAGDWFVIVQYADQPAYDKAQTVFASDPECQQTFIEIAKFAKRISRSGHRSRSVTREIAPRSLQPSMKRGRPGWRPLSFSDSRFPARPGGRDADAPQPRRLSEFDCRVLGKTTE